MHVADAHMLISLHFGCRIALVSTKILPNPVLLLGAGSLFASRATGKWHGNEEQFGGIARCLHF